MRIVPEEKKKKKGNMPELARDGSKDSDSLIISIEISIEIMFYRTANCLSHLELLGSSCSLDVCATSIMLVSKLRKWDINIIQVFYLFLVLFYKLLQ